MCEHELDVEASKAETSVHEPRPTTAIVKNPPGRLWLAIGFKGELTRLENPSDLET